MLDLLIKSGSVIDGTGRPAKTGDIGIKDGVIVETGAVSTASSRTINADGAIVAPGWVDTHTHYDGQVAWDDELAPSSNHGVTTVVMGNCGVGFAPVRPNGAKALIELMEGVEDIPGTALYEGMPWGEWVTFEDYLDFLDGRKYTMDIGAQLPHGALRSYVMGEQESLEGDATADQIEDMCRHVKRAMIAGAMGFSTSRTIGHRSISGSPVPGTFAAETELISLANAMKSAGRGVFQAIPASVIGDLEFLGGEKKTLLQEIELFANISRESGRKLTYTQLQVGEDVDQWRKALDEVDIQNGKGAQIFPQVTSRGVGFMTSLRTYHMFMRRETYIKMADLSHEDRLRELKTPEIRSRILADKDIRHPSEGSMENVYEYFGANLHQMFKLRHSTDYEPEESRSMAALARAQGCSAQEIMYDTLIQGDGTGFCVLLGPSYHQFSLEPVKHMIEHKSSVLGLGDAGAHVNFVSDGVLPTFSLIHWARDRQRGDKLPIELIINKQTAATASLYGLKDRGVLAIGKRADLNIIDLEKLSLGEFELKPDLPAGGTRILQSARGYVGTFVKGQQTRENGQDLGSRPGRLIRGVH